MSVQANWFTASLTVLGIITIITTAVLFTLDILPPNKYNRKKLLRKVGPYGITMLILITYIVRADKVFNGNEKKYVFGYLLKRFGNTVGKWSFIFIREILNDKINLEKTCEEAVRYSDYESRLHLLYLLFGIIASDDVVKNSEIAAITRIAELLEISSLDFNSIKAIYTEQRKTERKEISKETNGLADAFEILGIPDNSTDAEIKSAYRALAKKHHPDKVSHLGESHFNIAQEKFMIIQLAYEKIKSARNIS